MKIFEIDYSTKVWAKVGNIDLKIPSNLVNIKQKINDQVRVLLMLVNSNILTQKSQIDSYKNEINKDADELIRIADEYLKRTSSLADDSTDKHLLGRRDKVERVKRSIQRTILKLK